MCMLSVIVPIYNSELFLRNCVFSILNQKYKDMELILVDDGSTDASSGICDEFALKNNNVRVIHQKNSGPIKARYNGVMASNGKYITFVDADDWIDIDTYLCLSHALEKNVDLIVYGKIVEKEGSGLEKPEKIYDDGFYNKEELKKKIINTAIWNFDRNKSGLAHSLNDKIFKREILLKSYKNAEGLTRFHFGEDAMILFPILQWVNSIYICNKYMYHYRKSVGEVPKYLKDDDFFCKLYIWYEYLSKNLQGIPDGIKQLEYIYVYLINTRKEIYGDFKKNDDFIFPFRKVPVDSRIVLYGAGQVGCSYYDQIKRSKYCKVVAWVDKNYIKYSNKKIVSCDELKKIKFDYIVIAIQSDVIRQEVANRLIEDGYSVIN